MKIYWKEDKDDPSCEPQKRDINNFSRALNFYESSVSLALCRFAGLLWHPGLNLSFRFFSLFISYQSTLNVFVHFYHLSFPYFLGLNFSYFIAIAYDCSSSPRSCASSWYFINFLLAFFFFILSNRSGGDNAQFIAEGSIHLTVHTYALSKWLFFRRSSLVSQLISERSKPTSKKQKPVQKLTKAWNKLASEDHAPRGHY